MSWPKGKPRPPGAGRRAGTPNKKTKDLAIRCRQLNLDVWDEMIRLVQGTVDVNYKLAALKEMMKYLYPQRKALEMNAEVDVKLNERIKELDQLPDDELKKLVK